MAEQENNFATGIQREIVHNTALTGVHIVSERCGVTRMSAHFMVLQHLVEALAAIDPKGTSKALRAMAQAYSPTSTEKEKRKADETIIATVNQFHDLAMLAQSKVGGTV